MRIVDWSADVCSSDLAAGRGRAEGVERLGLGAPAPAALRRLGDADDRRVHADVEDFGGARQLRIFAVVKQIGAITPEPRHDDLAALGMRPDLAWQAEQRSEEHTSELQSLMRISYAVFCLKKQN